MSATNPTQETKSTNAGSAAEPKSNGGTVVQPT